MTAFGFFVDIGAAYNAVNDGIACNGISFTGDPQVFLGGPLINYSPETTVIANSTRLTFDLSGYQGQLNPPAFSGTDSAYQEL